MYIKKLKLRIFILLFLLIIIIDGNKLSFANNKGISEISKSYTITKDLIITPIQRDVFIVKHSYPWPSNSIVALMSNGEILLIDTPYTPDATRRLLKWINSSFGNRTIKAINTHFHIDRLGGNEALKERNIPIYGSELTERMLLIKAKKSLNAILDWVKDERIKNELAGVKFIAPTHIFNAKDGLNLKFGKENVMLTYYGPGHSLDNIVVYLSQKKILFAGCMIIEMEKNGVGNTSDAYLDEWINSLKKIRIDNDVIVIPGHGKVSDKRVISHTIDVLDKRMKNEFIITIIGVIIGFFIMVRLIFFVLKMIKYTED